MGICKNNRNVKQKEKNELNNNFCHKIRSYDVPNRIFTIIVLQDGRIALLSFDKQEVIIMNLFYNKVDFIYKKEGTRFFWMFQMHSGQLVLGTAHSIDIMEITDKTLIKINSIDNHPMKIGIALTNNRIATYSSNDECISIYSIDSNIISLLSKINVGTLTSMIQLKEKEVLVSATNVIAFWNLEQMKVISSNVLTTQTKAIEEVYDKLIVANLYMIIIYDTDTYQKINSFEYRALTFMEMRNNFVFIGGYGGRMAIFDIKSNRIRYERCNRDEKNINKLIKLNTDTFLMHSIGAYSFAIWNY